MRPERLGIHTVYTPLNRRGTTKLHDMMRFEAITMVMSCLCWKKFQGPIKLYCDKDFYAYIKKLGVDSLWDEIDTTTVHEGFADDVNHDMFWAYAKMYVNSLQNEPFVSIDLDLFQAQYYDYSVADIVCSHIELSDYANDNILNRNKPVYYPNYFEWDIFKDRFSKFPNLKFEDYSLNVAVLAVNKPEFCKEVFEIAQAFAKGNNFDPQDVNTHGYERYLRTIHSSSMITFIEQRLAAAVASTNNYSVRSLINLLYDGGQQGWVKEDQEFINPGITHLWGWKATMKTESGYEERISLTKELDKQFFEMFPIEYAKHIPSILKYCKE